VVAAEGGYCHTLALDDRGRVWSLGCGDDGQRGAGGGGDEDEAARPAATEVSLPPGAGPAVAVAAGANHSVALTASGAAFAWGSNECVVDSSCGVAHRYILCLARFATEKNDHCTQIRTARPRRQ
jgi:alpha-tubulin suppressor-like RCC1 family protein